MPPGIFYRPPPYPQQRRPLIPAPAVGTYPDEVQADSPSVYWRMGESSGTFVDTMVGNDATATGTPTRDVANTELASDDGAVSFPSDSDLITAADGTDLDLGDGPFTIEFWGSRSADGTGFQAALSKGTNGYNVAIADGLGSANDDKLFLGKVGATIVTRGSANVPADGSIHHYVITRSGTGAGNTLVYTDGVESHVGVSEGTALADTALSLTIGQEGGSSRWRGLLDEIAIYKSVLSADRIATHYAARLVAGGGTAVDRTAADALTSADSLARLFAGFRVVADGRTQADVATRTGAFLRATSDSTTLADVATASKLFLRTVADAVGLSDVATRTGAFLRSTADAVTHADVATRTGGFLRSVADASSRSDVATRLGAFLRSTADALSLADVVEALKQGAILRTASDALTAADAAIRSGTFLRAATDALTASDVATRVKGTVRSAADALAAADVATRTVALLRSAADAVGLADLVAAAGGSLTFIGGLPHMVGSAVSAAVSAIANRLGPPGGGASSSTPGGSATHAKPEH